ncbi:MAG: leucine-rich repeat domain-containing protein [Clostridia bacterium]|nr:leucine-rich repeat domain-containing protein [Clostridia bacterium]
MKKKIVLTLLIVSVLVCLLAISASATNVDGIYYSFYKSGDVYTATVNSNNVNCELEYVSIPEYVSYGGTVYKVTALAENAFSGSGSQKWAGNKHIKKVIIPSTVSSIGKHCFRNCATVEEVIINGSHTAFKDAEFYGCANLKVLDMSGMTALTSFGGYFTTGASKLETVIMPNTVTSISGKSFQSPKLTTLVLSSNVVSIGENAFQGAALKKVILPSTLTTTAKDIFNKNPLEVIVFGNPDVSGYTNTLLSSCGNINLVFYAGSDATVLTNKFSQFSSWTNFVSYEDYLNNPNATYTNTIVYGTQNCQDCGDVITNLEYFKFTSFTEEMHDAYMCQNCGKVENESKITNTYAPILTFSGYSAKIDGSKICVGYTVNYESLRIYESKMGIEEGTVKFGITASPVSSIYAKYETVKNDLKPMSNAIVTEVSGSIPAFDFILTDFTEEFYDKPLVMCAYVYDGNDIYYVDAGGCSNYATPITYNIIANA